MVHLFSYNISILDCQRKEQALEVLASLLIFCINISLLFRIVSKIVESYRICQSEFLVVRMMVPEESCSIGEDTSLSGKAVSAYE